MESRKAFTRKDLYPIGLVLFAALALFVYTRLSRPGAGTVRVYRGEELWREFPVGTEETITVTGEDGAENVIRMDAEGVWMESSTCRNQICVDTGKLVYAELAGLDAGNWIVCLPNGVSVEVDARRE